MRYRLTLWAIEALDAVKGKRRRDRHGRFLKERPKPVFPTNGPPMPWRDKVRLYHAR